MNCRLAKVRLMSAASPDQLPAELDSHLAACGECREWHGLLVQLERHVPFIPVPRSQCKSQFLRQLVKNVDAEATDAAAATLSAVAAQTLPYLPAAKPSRARTMTAGLAASVLVLVLGGWLVHGRHFAFTTPPSGTSAADTLLATLMKRDLRLAKAGTPGERIAILADVAEQLREETLSCSATDDQLMALAQLYDQVVREGILKQAESLPAADRPRILGPIAERLDQAASKVEQISQGVPPEYSRPLQTIAAAAHEGYNRLRALLPESRA